MVDKALDAACEPEWFTLEQAEGLRIKVRALTADERGALVRGVEKAPFIGHMLLKDRQAVGADLPTEQERTAAQVAWAVALPPEKRKALALAETHGIRTLEAWVKRCVVAVEVEGEPCGSTLAELLGSIADPTLYVDVLLEAAGLCQEFSTLGKAGPMCSARLCGAPTPTPAGGPASDALPHSGACEATAEAPSLTAPDSLPESKAAPLSATTRGG